MMGWLKRGRERTAARADGAIVIPGARKSGGGRTKSRIVMTMSIFFAVYAVMAGRLVYYGTHQPEDNGPPAGRPTAARPDIVDRNGEILATDIKTASLYAEPRRIVDIDEAIDKLATVLPDIDYEQTYNKLNSKAGFVWLRRQLTPKQEADILQLGIPGIGFRSEKRRFYPAGSTVAHVVGLLRDVGRQQDSAGVQIAADQRAAQAGAGLRRIDDGVGGRRAGRHGFRHKILGAGEGSG